MSKKNATFGWNELMTTDVDGAKKFYSEIFGWGVRDVALANPTKLAEGGEPAYTLWTIGDMEAGGAMKLEGPEMEGIPPHWMSYVNVGDVDATAQKVTDNGGKVVAGPMDIEGVGRFYVISDPQGAVLGIGTSSMKKD